MVSAIENLATKLRNSDEYKHLNLPPTLYIKLEIINMLKSYAYSVITVNPLKKYLNERHTTGPTDTPLSGYSIMHLIEKMPEFLPIAHFNSDGKQTRCGRIKYKIDHKAFTALEEKIRGFETIYDNTRNTVGFPTLKEKMSIYKLENRGFKQKLFEVLDCIEAEYNLRPDDLVWLCDSLNVKTNANSIKRRLTAYRNPVCVDAILTSKTYLSNER